MFIKEKNMSIINSSIWVFYYFKIFIIPNLFHNLKNNQ
jgi:hypothetical protein